MPQTSIQLTLCVIGCLISGLLTVSIDSLYGNLKAVMKPVDIKHSKAALDDIEVAPIKLFNDYTVTLNKCCYSAILVM